MDGESKAWGCYTVVKVERESPNPVDQCKQSPSAVPRGQLPVQQGQAKRATRARVSHLKLSKVLPFY